MALSRELKVVFTSSTSSLSRGLKTVSSDVDNTTSKTSKLGSALSTWGPVAAAGAAAVGAAVFAIGKKAVEAAQESQVVNKQTKAVLKSTGDAAGVTLGHVQKLAGSIQNYSGQSDEAVQSTENLLLTFTDIRNEVGKGNRIFDIATKTAVDMSQTFGQDLKSSSIQLGKALQDPIKGLGSLSRIGVQFNAQQVKTVTHLTETGHKLEAQKLILGEVRKQVGGSAKAYGQTFSGALDRAKQAVDNVFEAIGKALLPTLKQLATSIANFANSKEFQAWLKDATKWMREWIPKILQAAKALGGPLVRTIGDVVSALGHIVSAIQTVIGWFDKLTGAADAAGSAIGNALRSAASGLPGIGPLIAHRASGGPLRAGQAALVGERGPEIIVPRTSSTVVPNYALGGAAVVINGDVYGFDDFARKVDEAQTRSARKWMAA